MTRIPARNNINQYRQVNNYTGVTDVDPHQLIQMLLDAAVGKLAIAKGIIERGERAQKGELIGQSISIINGLQSSLDMDSGGEIAANLNDLYDYMNRRLLLANMHDDLEIVNEVISLLHEIKSAWESIPYDARAAGSPAMATAK